jgi:hypothetical protein
VELDDGIAVFVFGFCCEKLLFFVSVEEKHVIATLSKFCDLF